MQVLERPPCSLVSGVGVAQHCAGLVMCRLFGNWSNRSNLTASEQQKSACTACRTRAYKHTHTQTHTHAPTPTPTREHLTPAHTLHTSNSSLPLSQFMKCCAASVLTGWGWGGSCSVSRTKWLAHLQQLLFFCPPFPAACGSGAPLSSSSGVFVCL